VISCEMELDIFTNPTAQLLHRKILKGVWIIQKFDLGASLTSKHPFSVGFCRVAGFSLRFELKQRANFSKVLHKFILAFPLTTMTTVAPRLESLLDTSENKFEKLEGKRRPWLPWNTSIASGVVGGYRSAAEHAPH
jgi:hypothetical protein